MKKLIFLLIATLVLATITFADTKGVYNQTVNGTFNLLHTESSEGFVYNAGTNVIYVAFGGYSVVSTNDPTTYYANRLPIRPAATYNFEKEYSLVSVYCVTNGLVDIGFEGKE